MVNDNGCFCFKKFFEVKIGGNHFGNEKGKQI